MAMYPVEQEEPSENFRIAWACAGKHIQQMGQGGVIWLRADLNPPMAEHLSFRIGNQLFFIFVATPEAPFNPERNHIFLDVASEATAIPCIIEMQSSKGAFEPINYGWGMINAITGKPVNPLELVSDELIEMSDWELHDFAVQVVRTQLENDGKKIFGVQPSPHIQPSLWFEDKQGSHWVVIKATRYPNKYAELPANIEEMNQFFSSKGMRGYIARLIVANANDPFDPLAIENGNFIPVFRGHGLMPLFKGLEPI